MAQTQPPKRSSEPEAPQPESKPSSDQERGRPPRTEGYEANPVSSEEAGTYSKFGYSPARGSQDDASAQLAVSASEVLYSVKAAVEAATKAFNQIGWAVGEAWEAIKEAGPPNHDQVYVPANKGDSGDRRSTASLQPMLGHEPAKAIIEAACALRDMAIAIRETVVYWQGAGPLSVKPQASGTRGHSPNLRGLPGAAWEAVRTAQEFADAASDAAHEAQMAAERAMNAARATQGPASSLFPTLTHSAD
jgi:hypothetical protein